MALCELEEVSRIYGSGPTEVRALDRVSVSVEAGEFTAFSGPSGSGKTTLLNLVGCLDRADEGRVQVDGQDVGSLDARALARLRAARIGFVFQSFNLIPVLTAVENVELALQLAHARFEDPRGASERALERVGLGALFHRRPGQLSGGQQQRVAIARALVKEPALVIADEPTANLDSKTGAACLDLMRQMNDELGVTFLFSTHDPMVMEQARRVVRLHDGRIESDERQEA